MVFVLTADDPKSGQYSEDEGWQFITLGDQVRYIFFGRGIFILARTKPQSVIFLLRELLKYGHPTCSGFGVPVYMQSSPHLSFFC